MLSGVYISLREYMANFPTLQKLKLIHYQENISFGIGPDILREYNVNLKYFPKFSILESNIILYAPRVFKRIMAQDGL